MIDKTTVGVTAEAEEVEAALRNLCGYHLAEPDPLVRYTVLTQEQVLYDALVAAIKRERGRALAELAAAGHKATQIADLTNLTSRQQVQRLITLARNADAAEDGAVQALAASRSFEDRMAAVEATLDEVVSGIVPPTPAPVAVGPAVAFDAVVADPLAVASQDLAGTGQNGYDARDRQPDAYPVSASNGLASALLSAGSLESDHEWSGQSEASPVPAPSASPDALASIDALASRASPAVPAPPAALAPPTQPAASGAPAVPGSGLDGYEGSRYDASRYDPSRYDPTEDDLDFGDTEPTATYLESTFDVRGDDLVLAHAHVRQGPAEPRLDPVDDRPAWADDLSWPDDRSPAARGFPFADFTPTGPAEPDTWIEDSPMLEPTQVLPALRGGLHQATDLPRSQEDLPWWRRVREPRDDRDTGAA
ncbi:MAG TPA: hypothetical protein VF163_04990 [Micromonosporaceae bacterium]